jgi:Domain of unknown function (DUF5666)
MNDFYEFTDLRVGMRINVEGACAPDGIFRAQQISIKGDGDEDEIAASIDSVDPAAGVLQVLGLRVRVSGDVEIKDIDKRPLTLGALESGMRIKTKGQVRADGSFEPLKIKLRTHTPDEMDEIEGTITSLDPANHSLRVLGFHVVCDADVEIEA